MGGRGAGLGGVTTSSRDLARQAEQYITTRSGALINGQRHVFYVVDYDTPGGHVHREFDTKEAAIDSLRRNGVIGRQ